MPAYYIFDQEQQSGPYEIVQITGMWSRGSITANAQYSEDATHERRPVSALLAAHHPVKTLFQRVAAEVNEVQRVAAKIKAEKNTPEAKARQKRTERIVAICLAVFILFLVGAVLIKSQHLSDSSSSSTTTSGAFNMGYRDGQTAGRDDARRRHAEMGFSTRHSEAARHSAGLSSTGLSRQEYENGWSAGYSSGYNSYSK
jgi:hypothetical protein